MRKFSKNYIYYHLILDFIVIFFVLLCFFTEVFSNGEAITSENLPNTLLKFFIAFSVLYLLKTLYTVLYYLLSSYKLTENNIECKRGVFYRKNSILEYEKIRAVNVKQNFFHRLFKISVLTLDSGSVNKGFLSKILIIEKEDAINEILEEIKSKSIK